MKDRSVERETGEKKGYSVVVRSRFALESLTGAVLSNRSQNDVSLRGLQRMSHSVGWEDLETG